MRAYGRGMVAAPELWPYPSPQGGGGSMRARPGLKLHSLQTPQSFSAPSLTYPGICLSGLHKKPGNLHMGPGTTPASSSVGIWSFGLTSSCLRVVLGQKEALNSSGVRTRHTASDRPRTYGTVTTGPCDWSSIGLVGAGVALCYSTPLGDPLTRACLMCLVSWMPN